MDLADDDMTLGMPAAACHSEQPAQGFDAGLSLMFCDKDIHHLRRFAKYVAVDSIGQRNSLDYPYVLLLDSQSFFGCGKPPHGGNRVGGKGKGLFLAVCFSHFVINGVRTAR